VLLEVHRNSSHWRAFHESGELPGPNTPFAPNAGRFAAEL